GAADAALDELPGCPARHLLAVQEHLAGARLQETGDDIEERRLACPVRPDERVYPTGANGEADVLDGDETVEALADSSDDEDWLLARLCGGGAGGSRPHLRQMGGLRLFCAGGRFLQRSDWLPSQSGGEGDRVRERPLERSGEAGRQEQGDAEDDQSEHGVVEDCLPNDPVEDEDVEDRAGKRSEEVAG